MWRRHNASGSCHRTILTTSRRLLYLLAAVTLLGTAAGPGRLLARLQRVAEQPSTAAALK